MKREEKQSLINLIVCALLFIILMWIIASHYVTEGDYVKYQDSEDVTCEDVFQCLSADNVISTETNCPKDENGYLVVTGSCQSTIQYVIRNIIRPSKDGGFYP